MKSEHRLLVIPIIIVLLLGAALWAQDPLRRRLRRQFKRSRRHAGVGVQRWQPVCGDPRRYLVAAPEM